MAGMSDFAFSTKMRDVITSLIEDTVQRIRPADRYGVVTAVDTVLRTATVIPNGETNSIVVSYGALRPLVAQVVRIGGTPADRYIKDILGIPSILESDVTGLASDLSSINGTLSSHTSSISTNTSAISALQTATADTGWITPTLVNGWSYYGSPFSVPGYRKVGNRVTLRGLVRNGSSTIFTLPAGYCPPYQLLLAGVTAVNTGSESGQTAGNNGNTGAASTGTAHTHPLNNHIHNPGTLAPLATDTGCRFDISPAGTVAPTASASNAYVSIDGLEFFVN